MKKRWVFLFAIVFISAIISSFVDAKGSYIAYQDQKTQYGYLYVVDTSQSVNLDNAEEYAAMKNADYVFEFILQGGAFVLDFSALTSKGRKNIIDELKKYVNKEQRRIFAVIQTNPSSQKGYSGNILKRLEIYHAAEKDGKIAVISEAHSAGSDDPYQKAFVDAFVDGYYYKNAGNGKTEYFNPYNVKFLVTGQDTNSGYVSKSDPDKRWPFRNGFIESYAGKKSGGLNAKGFPYIRYIMAKGKTGDTFHSMRSKPDPHAFNVITTENHWSIAWSRFLHLITIEAAIQMMDPQDGNGNGLSKQTGVEADKLAVKRVLDNYELQGAIKLLDANEPYVGGLRMASDSEKKYSQSYNWNGEEGGAKSKNIELDETGLKTKTIWGFRWWIIPIWDTPPANVKPVIVEGKPKTVAMPGPAGVKDIQVYELTTPQSIGPWVRSNEIDIKPDSVVMPLSTIPPLTPSPGIISPPSPSANPADLGPAPQLKGIIVIQPGPPAEIPILQYISIPQKESNYKDARQICNIMKKWDDYCINNKKTDSHACDAVEMYSAQVSKQGLEYVDENNKIQNAESTCSFAENREASASFFKEDSYSQTFYFVPSGNEDFRKGDFNVKDLFNYNGGNCKAHLITEGVFSGPFLADFYFDAEQGKISLTGGNLFDDNEIKKAAKNKGNPELFNGWYDSTWFTSASAHWDFCGETPQDGEIQKSEVVFLFDKTKGDNSIYPWNNDEYQALFYGFGQAIDKIFPNHLAYAKILAPSEFSGPKKINCQIKYQNNFWNGNSRDSEECYGLVHFNFKFVGEEPGKKKCADNGGTCKDMDKDGKCGEGWTEDSSKGSCDRKNQLCCVKTAPTPVTQDNKCKTGGFECFKSCSEMDKPHPDFDADCKKEFPGEREKCCEVNGNKKTLCEQTEGQKCLAKCSDEAGFESVNNPAMDKSCADKNREMGKCCKVKEVTDANCKKFGDNFKCNYKCGINEKLKPGDKLCTQRKECCEVNTCKITDINNKRVCKEKLDAGEENDYRDVTNERDPINGIILKCFGSDKCFENKFVEEQPDKCETEHGGTCKDINEGCDTKNEIELPDPRHVYCSKESVCCIPKPACESEPYQYTCRSKCEANEEPAGIDILDKSCRDEYLSVSPVCCKPINCEKLSKISKFTASQESDMEFSVPGLGNERCIKIADNQWVKFEKIEKITGILDREDFTNAKKQVSWTGNVGNLVFSGIYTDDKCEACEPDCAGKKCGADGCGGLCPPGCSGIQTCNSAGQCISTPCVPQTCAQLGKSCGRWDNGCAVGVMLDCGDCDVGKSCNSAGQCISNERTDCDILAQRINMKAKITTGPVNNAQPCTRASDSVRGLNGIPGTQIACSRGMIITEGFSNINLDSGDIILQYQDSREGHEFLFLGQIGTYTKKYGCYYDDYPAICCPLGDISGSQAACYGWINDETQFPIILKVMCDCTPNKKVVCSSYASPVSVLEYGSINKVLDQDLKASWTGVKNTQREIDQWNQNLVPPPAYYGTVSIEPATPQLSPAAENLDEIKVPLKAEMTCMIDELGGRINLKVPLPLGGDIGTVGAIERIFITQVRAAEKKGETEPRIFEGSEIIRNLGKTITKVKFTDNKQQEKVINAVPSSQAPAATKNKAPEISGEMIKKIAVELGNNGKIIVSSSVDALGNILISGIKSGLKVKDDLTSPEQINLVVNAFKDIIQSLSSLTAPPGSPQFVKVNVKAADTGDNSGKNKKSDTEIEKALACFVFDENGFKTTPSSDGGVHVRMEKSFKMTDKEFEEILGEVELKIDKVTGNIVLESPPEDKKDYQFVYDTQNKKLIVKDAFGKVIKKEDLSEDKFVTLLGRLKNYAGNKDERETIEKAIDTMIKCKGAKIEISKPASKLKIEKSGEGFIYVHDMIRDRANNIKIKTSNNGDTDETKIYINDRPVNVNIYDTKGSNVEVSYAGEKISDKESDFNPFLPKMFKDYNSNMLPAKAFVKVSVKNNKESKEESIGTWYCPNYIDSSLQIGALEEKYAYGGSSNNVFANLVAFGPIEQKEKAGKVINNGVFKGFLKIEVNFNTLDSSQSYDKYFYVKELLSPLAAGQTNAKGSITVNGQKATTYSGKTVNEIVADWGCDKTRVQAALPCFSYKYAKTKYTLTYDFESNQLDVSADDYNSDGAVALHHAMLLKGFDNSVNIAESILSRLDSKSKILEKIRTMRKHCSEQENFVPVKEENCINAPPQYIYSDGSYLLIGQADYEDTKIPNTDTTIKEKLIAEGYAFNNEKKKWQKCSAGYISISTKSFSYYYVSDPVNFDRESTAIKISGNSEPLKNITKIFWNIDSISGLSALYRFDDSEIEDNCEVSVINETGFSVSSSGGNFSALNVDFEFPEGTFDRETEVTVQKVQVSSCVEKTIEPGYNAWMIIGAFTVLLIVAIVIIVMMRKEKNRDFLE